MISNGIRSGFGEDLHGSCLSVFHGEGKWSIVARIIANTDGRPGIK
jgi:hypothetical protein